VIQSFFAGDGGHSAHELTSLCSTSRDSPSESSCLGVAGVSSGGEAVIAGVSPLAFLLCGFGFSLSFSAFFSFFSFPFSAFFSFFSFFSFSFRAFSSFFFCFSLSFAFCLFFSHLRTFLFQLVLEKGGIGRSIGRQERRTASQLIRVSVVLRYL